MKAVFAEVLAAGFDGATSDTDGRVLWIAAASMDDVRAALDGVPHAGLSEMTAAEVGGLACVDYFLVDPKQADDLRARLVEFSQTAKGAQS
jgi:hypothetical protein